MLRKLLLVTSIVVCAVSDKGLQDAVLKNHNKHRKDAGLDELEWDIKKVSNAKNIYERKCSDDAYDHSSFMDYYKSIKTNDKMDSKQIAEEAMS